MAATDGADPPREGPGVRPRLDELPARMDAVHGEMEKSVTLKLIEGFDGPVLIVTRDLSNRPPLLRWRGKWVRRFREAIGR